MKLKKGFKEASGMTEDDMQSKHTIVVDDGSGFNRVVAEMADDSEESRQLATLMVDAFNKWAGS